MIVAVGLAVLGILLVLLAAELRQEILTASIAGAVTQSDSAAEFRNDSSGFIWIRKIHAAHSANTMASAESASIEISKSPTVTSTVNNNPFYTILYRLQKMSGDAVDSGDRVNRTISYGKGQLVLEPNESLFVNVLKSSDPVVTFFFELEYEFA